MSYFLFMVFCLNKLSAIFIPFFYFISILYTCVLQSFSKYLLLKVQRSVNTSSCKCLVFSNHYLLLTNTLKQYGFSYLNVIMLLSQKVLFNENYAPKIIIYQIALEWMPPYKSGAKSKIRMTKNQTLKVRKILFQN